jgi:hypothetical protein
LVSKNPACNLRTTANHLCVFFEFKAAVIVSVGPPQFPLSVAATTTEKFSCLLLCFAFLSDASRNSYSFSVPVKATGLRITTSNGGDFIDELEVYGVRNAGMAHRKA